MTFACALPLTVAVLIAAVVSLGKNNANDDKNLSIGVYLELH